MRWRAGIALIGLLLLMPISARAAEEPKNKGLFITPVRSYQNVSPGHSTGGTFTVANITTQPADIDLSVQQFSVSDYNYDYQFSQIRDNWIHLSKTRLTLKPQKSETITYSVTAPADAAPGGHYFTLFATTKLEQNPNKVQAATTLYVTVDGTLSRTSHINSTTIPVISFGTAIDFSLDVKNTGNTHYFVYTSGSLAGLSASNEKPESTSLLLPGKSRVVRGTIPAPILPGVYPAVYGFKVDDGQIVEHKQLVIYIPPWSALLPIGIILLVQTIRRYRTKR